MGFLQARPAEWKSSRFDLWKREGLDLGLPDVSGVEYLIDMLAPSGLGWCKYGQMGGAEPVSWQEITAFSTGAGLDLEPWETRSLRAMSAAYVDGFLSGAQPLQVSPAFEGTPELDPGVAVERRQISDSMKAALSSMARRPKGRGTKRKRKSVG